MPFGAIRLAPGFNSEQTPTLNTAGIVSGNLIRWKQGLIEKLGGWIRFYPFSVGSIPRELHAWQDLSSSDWLAVGSTASLSVISNNVLTNITPQQTITNTAPNFTTSANSSIVQIVDANISNPTTNNSVFIATPVAIDGLVIQGLYAITSVISTHVYQITVAGKGVAGVSNGGAVPLFTTSSGSASVTVTLNNHGATAGQTYPFLVSTTGNGVTIFGTYVVQSVTDANNFVIFAANAATASSGFSENSGNVQFVYNIAIGPQPAAAGYGTGNYGAGTYGFGISGPSGTGTPITAIDWTSGNWGQILLTCPQGGGIYQWTPNSGFQTAQLVSTAPVVNQGIFVAMPFQIVVAYGSSKTGAPNPLQVSWSTIGDYTNWVPLTTDSAGNFQIPSGSMCVGGMSVANQQLIWTDIELWAMQFVGQPNVFGFNKLMGGCGLIGSHAMGMLGSTVFWMSQKQFFMITPGGAPQSIPCTVWDYIFQNLDTTNAFKIRCVPNSTFNEVWWHFPSLSGGTGENDSYVKLNPTEGEWDYGKLPSTGRSAGIDQSVLGTPIMAGVNGVIYQHEQGYDGDSVPLNPTFTSGYAVIGDAEQFTVVLEFIPDFKYGLQGGAQNANLQVTLSSINYPSDVPVTYGPYTVNASSPSFMPRLRGRQVAITVAGADAGTFWRIGLNRYRFAPDGRR